jgi:predicted AAA+ superfamily ATPase
MKNTFDLQNLWRRSGYRFPEEPYIRRNIYDSLLRDLDSREITVVVGARQVGKTFLIKKLIEELLTGGAAEPRQVFYFNLDAFSLVDLVSNDRDLIDFINYYGAPNKKSFVILDEAQRVPEIGLLIKRYYDLGLDIKFIVSGSSSLQIKSQVKETLTGRKHLFELYPVSFGEFLRFKGLRDIRDLSRIMRFESDQYQRIMEEFVLFGGYPGVVKLDDREKKIPLLGEIYSSYVQKDISDFLKIEDVAGFNRLVRFISAQSGGLLKVNEVAKNVRISRHFVEKYLHALDETYVAAFLRPYFVNLGKAIIKTPKLYFLDTGIRNAVFSTFESLDMRADTGLLVENFIFSELVKTVGRNRLWFYRTNTGSEVDFLFVEGDQVIPVEAKYSLTRQKNVSRVFYTLAGHTTLRKGIVVTRDYLHEEKRGDLTVMFRPAWSTYALAEELGGK